MTRRSDERRRQIAGASGRGAPRKKMYCHAKWRSPRLIACKVLLESSPPASSSLPRPPEPADAIVQLPPQAQRHLRVLDHSDVERVAREPGREVRLDRPPHPLQHDEVAPRRRLSQRPRRRRGSITGRSLPLETTRSLPPTTASRTTGSNPATRSRNASSSAAVMSLMDATALAARTTAHPPRASSRAKGSIPSATSAPALSTNTTHLRQGDANGVVLARGSAASETGFGSAPADGWPSSLSREPAASHRAAKASKSSTHHGRGLSFRSRVSWKVPPPSAKSAADLDAPRSKMFPAKAPRTSWSTRAAGSAMASISARTLGSAAAARAFSAVLTSRKQSSKPRRLRHSSRSLHSFRTVGAPSNSASCAPARTASSFASKSAAKRSARAAASRTRASDAARLRNSGMDARNTATHSARPGRRVPGGARLATHALDARSDSGSYANVVARYPSRTSAGKGTGSDMTRPSLDPSARGRLRRRGRRAAIPRSCRKTALRYISMFTSVVGSQVDFLRLFRFTFVNYATRVPRAPLRLSSVHASVQPQVIEQPRVILLPLRVQLRARSAAVLGLERVLVGDIPRAPEKRRRSKRAAAAALAAPPPRTRLRRSLRRPGRRQPAGSAARARARARPTCCIPPRRRRREARAPTRRTRTRPSRRRPGAGARRATAADARAGADADAGLRAGDALVVKRPRSEALVVRRSREALMRRRRVPPARPRAAAAAETGRRGGGGAPRGARERRRRGRPWVRDPTARRGRSGRRRERRRRRRRRRGRRRGRRGARRLDQPRGGRLGRRRDATRRSGLAARTGRLGLGPRDDLHRRRRRRRRRRRIPRLRRGLGLGPRRRGRRRRRRSLAIARGTLTLTLTLTLTRRVRGGVLRRSNAAPRLRGGVSVRAALLGGRSFLGRAALEILREAARLRVSGGRPGERRVFFRRRARGPRSPGRRLSRAARGGPSRRRRRRRGIGIGSGSGIPPVPFPFPFPFPFPRSATRPRRRARTARTRTSRTRTSPAARARRLPFRRRRRRRRRR